MLTVHYPVMLPFLQIFHNHFTVHFRNFISSLELCFRRSKIHVKDGPHGCEDDNYKLCDGRCRAHNLPEQVVATCLLVIVPLKQWGCH